MARRSSGGVVCAGGFLYHGGEFVSFSTQAGWCLSSVAGSRRSYGSDGSSFVGSRRRRACGGSQVIDRHFLMLGLRSHPSITWVCLSSLWWCARQLC
ncbi:hypothetical protein HID58_074445, partial [Brassica napus]